MHRLPASLRRRALWGAGVAAVLLGLLCGVRFVRAGSAATEPAVGAAATAPTATDLGAVVAAPATDSVPFDHSIHAGTYGMACLFCHVDADKSTTAGLPSTRKCMGCHKFVAKDKPAVIELARLWQAQQVPRWRRVYDLPDYVYFSHRVHVAAPVACAECHGFVPFMSRIQRVSSLTMGWCLACHEDRHATRDCVACHK